MHRIGTDGTPDPVFFLDYWKNPEATAKKYSGDWCRTGDQACADADGYLWYQGRADDMFKSAGYRIGPAEIENCLVRHEAVANAAVVPEPGRDARQRREGVHPARPGGRAIARRWRTPSART